jgi:hypothetical protein
MHLYIVSTSYGKERMHRAPTDDHNDNTDQNRSASTKSLSNERRGHSSNEASDLVDGDDQSDHVRSSIRLGVDSKRFGESGRVDETSHEPIVVTYKQEPKAGKSCDRGKESVALEVDVREHSGCNRIRSRQLE